MALAELDGISAYYVARGPLSPRPPRILGKGALTKPRVGATWQLSYVRKLLFPLGHYPG